MPRSTGSKRSAANLVESLAESRWNADRNRRPDAALDRGDARAQPASRDRRARRICSRASPVATCPPGRAARRAAARAHVLPTGRNFYSVDPKAIPSPLAWEVGRTLADRLIERHIAETGRVPTTVGLVLWGTAAMRTTGDDIAEALALLGVRPTWEAESRRVSGLEVIPLDELGRPGST